MPFYVAKLLSQTAVHLLQFCHDPFLPIVVEGATFSKLLAFFTQHSLNLAIFANLSLEASEEEAKGHIWHNHVVLNVSNE